MSNIWDDEQIQPTGGDFIKFDAIGDKTKGRITAIRKQRFADDNAADGYSYAPQLDLTLADGSEATLTAGQWHLKKQLIELRPEVGDEIEVIHNAKQGRSKLFAVTVTRAADVPVPAAAPAKAAASKGSDSPPF